MPKLLVWSVFPTHHQSAFFAALRARGVDLVVHYYSRLTPERRELGWREPDGLPPGERYVPAQPGVLTWRSDWRERIHVVPGAHRPFLLHLALQLSLHGVPWLHWSEPSGLARSNPAKRVVRRAYGWLVDRHALGALAIGTLAHRDFAGWGIRDSRIRLLPYAIERPRCTAPLAAPHDASPPRLLFLGALEHRKGLDVLLHALATLRVSHPGAGLDVIGAGPQRDEYGRLAERLDLDTAVRFVGALPADRVGDAILARDVLVLPTRFDGWGMVLNEAAALGRALVSTESCGAAHHLIRPGQNGFRVPPDDPAALATALARYYDDPGLAARHGAASAALFEEYSPERNAARLLEALDDLGSRAEPRHRPALNS